MSSPGARSGRLERASDPAPVRIAHIGLGAFARSHQAWYTCRANRGGEGWGIRGFTGRSPAIAELMARQHGLYHLLARSEGGDSAELVDAVADVRDGADLGGFAATLCASSTEIVTITVSEAGYHYGPEGRIDDRDPRVLEDLSALSIIVAASGSGGFARALERAPVVTAPFRLLAGLEARRRSGGAPMTIVPCDNISSNGARLRALLRDAASRASEGLAQYIDRDIAFVDTSVDRITPATTPSDVERVRLLTGYEDPAVVVTEPYTDWILSGRFAGVRPAWEHAGARFVDDVAPFERRKLWLLNGAHSLLAYAGMLRGRATVDEAIRDPVLRTAVEAYWDEAASLLPGGLGLPAYRSALTERFENGRIRHLLRQISAEGSTKIAVRAVPVLVGRRARGLSCDASLNAVACWIAWVMRAEDIVDARIGRLLEARSRPRTEAVERIAAIADERLAADRDLLTSLQARVGELLDSAG